MSSSADTPVRAFMVWPSVWLVCLSYQDMKLHKRNERNLIIDFFSQYFKVQLWKRQSDGTNSSSGVLQLFAVRDPFKCKINAMDPHSIDFFYRDNPSIQILSSLFKVVQNILAISWRHRVFHYWTFYSEHFFLLLLKLPLVPSLCIDWLLIWHYLYFWVILH